MKNIKGTVTISVEDFDNMRNEYDKLVNDIKFTYILYDRRSVSEKSGAYVEIDVNKVLKLIEKIEYGKFFKFQEQNDGVITVGEKENCNPMEIDDDDIPF